MSFILRVIRAFVGIVAVFQFFGIPESFSTLVLSETVNTETIIFFIIKVLIFVVAAGIFIGLRSLINSIYARKHNEPHPTLKNPWAL